VARLERPLKETWPAGAGELLGYEMGFTPEELLVKIRYQSATALDATAQEILAKVLKAELKVDKLRLEFQQEKPAPLPKKPLARRATPPAKK
jgi:hypothetical protein